MNWFLTLRGAYMNDCGTIISTFFIHGKNFNFNIKMVGQKRNKAAGGWVYQQIRTEKLQAAQRCLWRWAQTTVLLHCIFTTDVGTHGGSWGCTRYAELGLFALWLQIVTWTETSGGLPVLRISTTSKNQVLNQRNSQVISRLLLKTKI